MTDLPTEKKYIASSAWKGSHYANHSEWQFRIANTALDYIQIPTHAKILDIGCGDGRFTKYLASVVHEGEVIGLGPSHSMLTSAYTHVMPNLTFILGDALHLPYKNQFDRMLCQLLFSSYLHSII